MADWNVLFEHLAAGPREDGTPELTQTASWLVGELGRRGLAPETWAWTAHPWRLRAVGIVALLGAGLYVWALLRQKRWVALAVTLAVPLYIIAELDFGVPLLGPLHSAEQVHVIATLPSTEAPTQRLVFSAHYDTKTDLLDHVERAPIQLAGIPLTLLMLVGVFWTRLKKAALIGAALNGLGLFLVQTGGAFVPTRSPGAVDDGAGCAVLLELGAQLREQPLQHTEVKLVFFSGEEIGIEGSKTWVARGLDRSLPLHVINLDGVGLSPELSLFRSESGVVRSFHYDEKLVATLDAVSPLYRAPWPATTDARAFLEAQVPAVNLSSELPSHWPARGMHSKHDALDRVDRAALDSTLKTLAETARRLDMGAH